MIAALIIALPLALLLAAICAPPRWAVVRPDQWVASDYLVVLGGEDSRARYAAQCYHRGIARRVLVSGTGDALTHRNLLVAFGVPPEAIEVESSSQSTMENAATILRKAGARKVTIVTSTYHSARAFATFRHVMPEITFYCLSVDRNEKVYTSQTARLEIYKRLWYFLWFHVPIYCF